MASSINASTSGGGGVIVTSDATGNLDIQSGGSTVVAVSSTGVAVTGTLAVSGAVTLTGGLNAALPVLSGGTGVTTKTGTGAVVLGTSPTLTTPTFDSASLPTISGTAPLYMCRAWVNFNGTGTVAIRASGNVSSITDNGTGDYTVNFTTAMVDANYSFSSLTGNTLAGTDQFGSRVKAAPTTTALQVLSTYGNTAYDIVYFGLAIFR